MGVGIEAVDVGASSPYGAGILVKGDLAGVIGDGEHVRGEPRILNLA